MVLESLFDDAKILHQPFFMLAFGFIASGVAIWVSFLALSPFSSSTALLAVAFITIAAAPHIHSLFVKQETRDALYPSRARSFFGRNFGLVKVYVWLFIGITAAYAFWYVVLPDTATPVCVGSACMEVPATGQVFIEQEATLSSISSLRERLTGKAVGAVSSCGQNMACWFHVIFSNNLSVMLMALLFSFIFGAGAVFLIGWNASVVGVSIGQSILDAQHTRFLGLLPHGVPELAGYFLGAIAGGLFSVALAKKAYRTREFAVIARDSFALLVLAVFSLLIGGLIEALLIVGNEGLALMLAMGYVLFLAVLTWQGRAEYMRVISKKPSSSLAHVP